MTPLRKIWNDSKLSVGSKIGLSIIAPIADKWCDFVQTSIGNKVAEGFAKQYEEERIQREEHPIKWFAKEMIKKSFHFT